MLARPGGRILFVAGQIASNSEGLVTATDLAGQFEVALANAVAVVRAAGGHPRDVGRLTIYVTDMDAYRGSLKEIGKAYRGVMGLHFPAMALVGVTELVNAQAVVEIEATAVLHGDAGP